MMSRFSLFILSFIFLITACGTGEILVTEYPRPNPDSGLRPVGSTSLNPNDSHPANPSMDELGPSDDEGGVIIEPGEPEFDSLTYFQGESEEDGDN